MEAGKSKICMAGQWARDLGEMAPTTGRKAAKGFGTVFLKPTQYMPSVQMICLSLMCKIHLTLPRLPRSISHYTSRFGLRPAVS